MDVVRKAITSMRGRIRITTEIGVGTKFRIELPLTLAIIDGTVVACGDETYILPTSTIAGSIRLEEGALLRPTGNGEILRHKEATYPFLRLSSLLDVPNGGRAPNSSYALIVKAAATTFALMVDDVVDQQQIIIKSLSKKVQNDWFTGAAVLRNGQIGLILNVDEMQRECSAPTAQERAVS